MIYPILVPLAGLEPARYFYRGILSPLRLPIPPQRRVYFLPNVPRYGLVGAYIFYRMFQGMAWSARIFFIEYSKAWLGRRIFA